MKGRSLLWLVVAALVAVAVMVVISLTRDAPWQGSGHHLKVFANLPVNEVTQIRVVGPNATLTVARKADRWRVAERSDYPAAFSKVRDLLRTLWDLKAVRELQVGPSQFDRLQISPPAKGGGTQVELTDAQGKSLGGLIIGKPLAGSQDDAGGAAPGRFVYQPADKDRVYVVSEGFYDLEPVEVSNWLDHDFIAGGDLDKVVRETASNNPGWTVVRPSGKGDWSFADGSPGEKVKPEAGNLLGHFSPSFTDVRPAGAPTSETGLDQPVRADLHTTDGFTYKLYFGKTGPDNARFLKVEVAAQLPPEPPQQPEEKKAGNDEPVKKAGDLKARLEREKACENWVYLVPASTVETLLKPRGELEARPKPALGGAPPPAMPDHPNVNPNQAELPVTGINPGPSPSMPDLPGPMPNRSEARTPPGSTAAPTEVPSPVPAPTPPGSP
ncbi:MAG TPA: DUF4340 domain-containing protein [Chthoniobacterales bacterium]